MAKKVNRSKYNFSKIEIGGSIIISALDLYSMKNALRAFNKQHGKSIKVSTEEITAEHSHYYKDVKVTRTA